MTITFTRMYFFFLYKHKICFQFGYSLKSLANATISVARFLRSDWATLFCVFTLYCVNCGTAMAAKIPMIATTIISSIKVKPCCFFGFRNCLIILVTIFIYLM